MTDIFISYARVDRGKAKMLVNAFEARGWSIWWDREIPTGKDFHAVIEAKIAEAKCVVVVWSRTSVNSHYVRAEANDALDHGKLFPVRIDDCRPGLIFRALQTVDFSDWAGDDKAPVFQTLAADIADRLFEETGNGADLKDRQAGAPRQFERVCEKQGKPFEVAALPELRSAQPAAAQPYRFIEPEMVSISGGTFLMGSPKPKLWFGFFALRGPDERQHEVVVDDFDIGKYPVTFAEYDRFCEATRREKPSDKGWGRERRPAIGVSWDDAFDYAEWLSAATGRRYRLPTEAEWEYAARAGTQTAYWWGEKFESDRANCNQIHGGTTPVDAFDPNAFGLFDMLGNVWEWTGSLYVPSYDGSETQSHRKDQSGRRVIRGGSWNRNQSYVRSAYRGRFNRDERYTHLGFRLARDRF